MAKVIWKGNGIGIVISEKGIKIIPPCDPQLLAALQAIAGIQGAHKALPAELQREASAFSGKLGGHAFAVAQKAAGERLDAEGGVVFYDAEDGFTCGSTGKPPIPLPQPGQIAFRSPVVTG
jgi:hypothetical protein